MRKYDPSDMLGLILNFPDQIEEAVAIGEGIQTDPHPEGLQHLVICGMGGSAIGGDLLRTYLSREISLPILVNRHYTLPRFVGPNSLVIVSSYSGNTEEALASFQEARVRKAHVVCLTSGGRLKGWAREEGFPVIQIPGGYPPRAALGFSFFPVLILLIKTGLVKRRSQDFQEVITLLRKKSRLYHPDKNEGNLAKQLAGELKGRFALIYASPPTEAVAMRWKGQFSENSKLLAGVNLFPELNHNEIVGFRPKPAGPIRVIFLKDSGDHSRIKARMDITKAIIEESGARVLEVHSEGKSLLARLFSLIYLGDFVSLYLAVLNKVDPTPVKNIDFLKSELAKIPGSFRMATVQPQRHEDTKIIE